MITDWSCTISSDDFKPEANGLYLMLLHVNLQPPHLALLYNHEYYSLSTQKVDVAKPFEPLVSIVKRKNIPCLIIHLSYTVNCTTVKKVLMDEFNKFKPISEDKITCLAPVKTTLEKIYQMPIKAMIVFDLLNALSVKGTIGNIYSYNLPKGNFKLKKYSLGDVLKQIRDLQNRD